MTMPKSPEQKPNLLHRAQNAVFHPVFRREVFDLPTYRDFGDSENGGRIIKNVDGGTVEVQRPGYEDGPVSHEFWMDWSKGFYGDLVGVSAKLTTRRDDQTWGIPDESPRERVFSSFMNRNTLSRLEVIQWVRYTKERLQYAAPYEAGPDPVEDRNAAIERFQHGK